MDILYLDNHLLIVNKPAGLLTQQTEGERDSLEERGKRFLKEKFQKKGNVFLQAAHRLDRVTSGLVILARTSKALSRLQESIRGKKFKKVYHALVEGEVSPQIGEWIHHLRHGDYKALLDEDSKECHLKYRTLHRNKETSCVEIELITGRYHQIRAQFALQGHPVVGDKKYGSQRAYLEYQIALHHALLEIPHPISRETLSFKCLAPFQSL